MSLHWLDYLTLTLYLAAILGMGFFFARKNVNTEEYFLGGRSFTGWVIGLSLVGTSISSVSFLAYPADAYKTAWLRYLPNLMLPIGVLIAAKYFLPFFRRGNVTTAYEYLEERFGPSVRIYGAVAFIAAQLFRISMILYLLSLLIQQMTGFDITTCIVLGGVFVAVYTILGGIDAVIWTDVMQTIVLVFGGLLCMVIIVMELPGGFAQIFSVASDHGKFAFAELREGTLHPVSWDISLLNKTATMMLLIGLINWLTEYCANQNTVQRYCAAKSTEEAKRGMLVCVCASLPIWAFFMFLGTSLYVFFQQFPAEPATAMLTGEQKAEQILPYFITHYLPPGVVGIVLAAAAAAAMSSLDSSINAITTVSIVDIYRRHLAKGRDDGHYLKMAWLIATVTSVLMIVGAIYLAVTETRTLQHTATILIALLSGGLLGLYLLGFFTRLGDARAIWCGIACTMVFTGWVTLGKNGMLPEGMTIPFDLYYTGIIGNIIMFVIGFTMGHLLKARSVS
jgi:SSS family solute:Na+ symporter